MMRDIKTSALPEEERRLLKGAKIESYPKGKVRINNSFLSFSLIFNLSKFIFRF